MFVLQALLYWLGLGLIAAALAREGAPRAAAGVLLLGAFPLFAGWQAAVLKDAQMAAAMLAATGIACWWRLADRRLPVAAGVAIALLLLYAAFVRANAVFAAAPLACGLFGWFGVRGWPRGRRSCSAWSRRSCSPRRSSITGPRRGRHRGRAQPAHLRSRRHRPSRRARGGAAAAARDLAGDGGAALLHALLLGPARRIEAIASSSRKASTTRRPARPCSALGRDGARHPSLMPAIASPIGTRPCAGWCRAAGRWRPAGGVRAERARPCRARSGRRGAAELGGWLAETPLGWPILWFAAALAALAFARRAQPLASTLALSAVLLEASFALVSISSDLRYHLWPMLATGIAWALIARAPPRGRAPLDRRRADLRSLPRRPRRPARAAAVGGHLCGDAQRRLAAGRQAASS